MTYYFRPIDKEQPEVELSNLTYIEYSVVVVKLMFNYSDSASKKSF